MDNNIFTNITSIEDLKKSSISFDDAFAKLQEISDQFLNVEEFSLQDNIYNHKLGILLAKYCEMLLNNATLELENIVNDDE